MADERTKKLNATRKDNSSIAGPPGSGSYPITDAKSVHSAYDLAGHAADPDAVRARVKSLAKKKGLTSALPKTAKEHSMGLGKPMTHRA
jgi:hypothetical protein